MPYSDEHVARLEAQADSAAHERRNLLAIIAELRGVLGTPDNASVVQHARDVVAEAQRAREDLAQALAWAAMVEADLRTALEQLQESRDEAMRAAVPWVTIGSIIFDWELTNDIDDAMHDLRTWYDANKPEEVQA
jgi:hypothetical protein